MSYPVFHTSFAGTSLVVLTRDMEMSEDAAHRSIGAATSIGYSTSSLRVVGRDGSRRRIVAALSHGKVSMVFDFQDTFCGSEPADFA